MCKTCMCSDMQREEMVDQLNTWAVKEEIPMEELDFAFLANQLSGSLLYTKGEAVTDLARFLVHCDK